MDNNRLLAVCFLKSWKVYGARVWDEQGLGRDECECEKKNCCFHLFSSNPNSFSSVPLFWAYACRSFREKDTCSNVILTSPLFYFTCLSNFSMYIQQNTKYVVSASKYFGGKWFTCSWQEMRTKQIGSWCSCILIDQHVH